ncbi:MAG TPA: PQQ-binding-like beta-propeller repeat protein [Jiangellaceae bacterium]|nr:PQQ-binding-like beta-propeller repeat protein [Jiangellaceae bacterium]
MPPNADLNTPPTAANGLVYASGSGTGDPAGMLFAPWASDGSIGWTQPVAHGSMSTPALDATSVFVSYACGVVYAFDRTRGVHILNSEPTGASVGSDRDSFFNTA